MSSHDAAIREWAPLAYHIARDFRFPGADRDDVRQEALIALWDALNRYDGSGTLRGWLAWCIRRRLSSKLRDARRPRHAVLSEALREPDVAHGGDGAWSDTTPRSPGGRDTDARRTDLGVRSLDVSGSLSALLAPLTPAQRRACLGVACGLTYAELGAPKAIDSALYRARKTLAAAAGEVSHG